ncbi:hypothetical protein MC885_016834, partial [Smutsia gigantea]
SFDSKFVYQQRGLRPIEDDTILVIDPNHAAVLQSSGINLFYLPHGLSVDKEGNYWVTDVALHQVFKLEPNSKEGPLLILGWSMQPGSDQNHFCQPTNVAVDPDTGAVYVSDGYCNSRIVQFSPSGKFITQWGEGLLFAVSGKPYFGDQEPVQGFVMNFSSGDIIDVFKPAYHPNVRFLFRQHFDMPHDIAASEDGTVYVGDAHTNTVWKFTSTEKMEHRSVKKAGTEVQEIKGKGSGGLNLGNFFASHQGYSRKGFDRLSTEGSDQEKDRMTEVNRKRSTRPLPTPTPASS